VNPRPRWSGRPPRVILTQLVMLLGPREQGWFPITALFRLTQLVLHPRFAGFPGHAHPAAHEPLMTVGPGHMEWAAKTGSGRYRADAVSFPVTGKWQLRVHLRTNDIDSYSAKAD
jgi:hypothetical protein